MGWWGTSVTLQGSRGDVSSVGDISTVSYGETYVQRAISVITPSHLEFDKILHALKSVKETRVEGFQDETLRAHLGGKLKIFPSHDYSIKTERRLAYAPSGAAKVCIEIAQYSELAYQYTWKGRAVLIISNGTRVLGLGPIGPLASLPVLEGKAALFSILTGLTMVPVPIDTRDPEEFIKTVKRISVG